MGYPIKQSTTAQPLMFYMVQSSDHFSAATGKSPTVTLSKNGGTPGSPAGTVSEVGNGWYKVAGNATDSGTLGPLALIATASGADQSNELFAVVSYDPQSASSLGLSNLDAQVSTRSTYAGGDTSGTTTLLARLTSTRAGLLDNLDAAISTRSTYAGGDTSGTTTLLGRIGQQINFTGSGASGLVKTDVIDVNSNPADGTSGGVMLANNALTAAALASDAVAEIQSGLMLASSYTAPANSNISAIKAITDQLATALEAAGGGNYQFTITALENAPTGGGGGGDAPTVEEITEGVWTRGTRALTDKAGFSLASTGLDLIATTVDGVANTFPKMVVQTWRRFFKRIAKDSDAGTLKTYADDGTTVLTTQNLTDDGEGNQTTGAAT